MSRIEITRNCRCGGSMVVTSNWAAAVTKLDAAFDEVHGGDECGPATAQEAQQVRREQDRTDRAGFWDAADNRASGGTH